MSGKVLVLGHDTRSFLATIRSLGRFKCEVHATGNKIGSPALFSRYIKKIHPMPPYSNSAPAIWIEAFSALLKNEGFDLVIPCHDDTIIPLQKHRNHFESLSNIYLLDDDAFKITSDKYEANMLAQSLGIPTPKFAVINNAANVNTILSELQLPLIAKSFHSYSIDNLHLKNKAQLINNREGLAELFRTDLVTRPIMVQECFKGSGVGVEILSNNGEILFAFQHIRIHEGSLGVSSYRKSVPLDKDLFGAATAFIKAIKYTGVAMCEFKVNSCTKDWRFIEINGRLWGSLPLAVAAGADFPRFLYEMLVKKRRIYPCGYRQDIYCRNLTMDMEYIRERPHTHTTTDTSYPLFLIIVMGLRNVLTLRERSDTFVIDDLAPGFVESLLWIAEKWRALINKATLKFISISIIKRTVVEKALRRKLEGARVILFVCKGNICRSPFAQLYASKALSMPRVILSAGYLPPFSRNVPLNAAKASEAFDVDLSAHRSMPVTEQSLREADIIFVFDAEDMKMITELHPAAKNKIFYLGVLGGENTVIIEDPISTDLENFERTYRIISSCILKISSLISC